jgi:antitoxin (DNA-binding transcriptional repressor) of toxin-antitoxin stability system
MKTITAKQFQLNQSKILKQVAKGVSFSVTYHGKSWVELHPSSKMHNRLVTGSPEAFKKSLHIELQSTNLPDLPNYKKIRRQSFINKKTSE